MATTKQTQAAKRNLWKAQEAASKKRTIAHLPKSARRALQVREREDALQYLQTPRARAHGLSPGVTG